MYYSYNQGDELARRIFAPKTSRYRRNAMRGDCPNCGAGLRQKHYAKNQCWRCKGQLSAARSAYTFGRVAGGDLGLAARRYRRRRFRRRRNPGYFHHDAGVFGGPSFGSRRLRRYNPAWMRAAGGALKRGAVRAGQATKKWYDEKGRDQMISMGKRAGRFAGRTAGRVASAAGRKLQQFGDTTAASMAEPARRRRLRRYRRRNPDCPMCGPVCTCGSTCDCGNKMCNCARRNPMICPDCDSSPCDCGSHSSYYPNPETSRWDPISAPTARWAPGQDWAEAEPVEEPTTAARYRRYRRNG